MEITSWPKSGPLKPPLTHLKHHTSTFFKISCFFFFFYFPRRGHLQVLGYTVFVSGALFRFAAATRVFPNVPVPIT